MLVFYVLRNVFNVASKIWKKKLKNQRICNTQKMQCFWRWIWNLFHLWDMFYLFSFVLYTWKYQKSCLTSWIKKTNSTSKLWRSSIYLKCAYHNDKLVSRTYKKYFNRISLSLSWVFPNIIHSGHLSYPLICNNSA